MIIHTTAEGITLTKKLENEATSFYEGLAQKYPQGAETFLSLAKDCQKYAVQIEMAYYSVISDAIEGCFAFNLETDKYSLDTGLAAKASYPDAVKKVIRVEETLTRFYTDAAQQCETVMADVPRVMKLVVQKRTKRKPELAALLA